MSTIRPGAPAALTPSEWELMAPLAVSHRDLLINRAILTPYQHLPGYMHRWWLFNPTPPQSDGLGRIWSDLPSIRIHHILRPDDARDMHNHPCDARTIILKGWYVEARADGLHRRDEGYTGEIPADCYHNITEVSEGGVWTMFIMGQWHHSWSFLTPDGLVAWREYLNLNA